MAQRKSRKKQDTKESEPKPKPIFFAGGSGKYRRLVESGYDFTTTPAKRKRRSTGQTKMKVGTVSKYAIQARPQGGHRKGELVTPWHSGRL